MDPPSQPSQHPIQLSAACMDSYGKPPVCCNQPQLSAKNAFQHPLFIVFGLKACRPAMEPIEDNNCLAASSSPVKSFPPPSTKSLIKDGTISGILPKTEVLSVHSTGYPSSTDRAIETLSGLSKIAKAWSCGLQSLSDTQDPDKDKRNFLELRFRPKDPYCHPAFGEPRPSSNFLLRISRTNNENTTTCAEQLSAYVVAKVSLAYHFEGMADYQHVIAVHEAKSRGMRRRGYADLVLGVDC